jgi:phosphate acetyltransferase
MDIFMFVSQKAKSHLKKIVFPEGENATIVRAAAQLKREKLLSPVLIGTPIRIKEIGNRENVDIGGIETIDPTDDVRLESFIESYSADRSLSERVSRRIVSQPLYFGAMMVKKHEADGLVAGIDYATNEVIMACELIIGLLPGTSVPSSFYLMDIPAYEGSQGSLLIFADPAVNPDPDPEQLADIAITTARSSMELLGWEPRVALLSFSTNGSASHPLTEKVIKALEFAKAKVPDLLVDGEMQVDTALDEAVAHKKMGRSSQVAGKANILIFPDLNAANIASKLVQRLAGARPFGPVLQGFSRPVCDLSRGATVQDVINTALLVAARV